jgi:hypothetical protein
VFISVGAKVASPAANIWETAFVHRLLGSEESPCLRDDFGIMTSKLLGLHGEFPMVIMGYADVVRNAKIASFLERIVSVRNASPAETV